MWHASFQLGQFGDCHRPAVFTTPGESVYLSGLGRPPRPGTQARAMLQEFLAWPVQGLHIQGLN